MTEEEFRSQDNRGEKEFDYVALAMSTCSPDFHGHMVGKQVLVLAVNAAINALNDLDKIKKSLFYGRDNNLTTLGMENCNFLPMQVGGADYDAVKSAQIIHGILGLATEAGELLEGLRNAYNGQGVDAVNVREESGDAKWYLAILANAFGREWREDEQVNIAKLKLRFPDKFKATDANVRDLTAERALLEQAALPPSHREVKMPGEKNIDGDAIEAQKPIDNA